MNTQALVLAAGAGTRMRSSKPKVAHEMLGKPLIRWVVDAAHRAGINHVVSVLGHQREQVEPLVKDDTTIVYQESRLGTGDAVNAARSIFEQSAAQDSSLVVLSGDCPLVRPETIAELVRYRNETQAAMVVLTMHLDNPFGYGRIVREGDEVLRIVEQKDASPQEALITECNAGLYCFDTHALFDALSRVSNNNAQGEYYLTDVLEICRNANRKVLAYVTDDPQEALGVNSRSQLACATKVMQHRINEEHMAQGVTMLDPDTVWIGPDVTIEADVELLPMTYMFGATSVGQGSVIGPNTRLYNTKVGEHCSIDETIAYDSVIDSCATTGPRAYLRPGTHLCEGAKVGTHVEIKKSTIGKNSKVPHLSYIGDAQLGSGVNIGAGTITCNYDGAHKHATVIEDDVFVGSDCMLVAPVTIGKGALVGAASCITRDVSSNAIALERSEQKEIKDGALRYKESHAKKTS